MDVNERADKLCARLNEDASSLRIVGSTLQCGSQLYDFGVRAAGGLQAGLRLAEICLAGLGQVSLVPAIAELRPSLAVQVMTDHPVAACMASQYAGWQLAGEKFFAMGSGPMRAAAGKEEVIQKLGLAEDARCAVGVLETSKLPSDSIALKIAADCRIPPERLTLSVARTASQAGTVQVVARSVETALHKLFELGFDLHRVQSAWGVAPLPPVAADDLAGIGRTNDAILYGGHVELWVRGDDESLTAIGPRVPSNASSDHGLPFAEIFERAGKDFYKIDPHLFSPARIAFHNLNTGRTQRFGAIVPELANW